MIRRSRNNLREGGPLMNRYPPLAAINRHRMLRSIRLAAGHNCAQERRRLPRTQSSPILPSCMGQTDGTTIIPAYAIRTPSKLCFEATWPTYKTYVQRKRMKRDNPLSSHIHVPLAGFYGSAHHGFDRPIPNSRPRDCCIS